MPTALESVLEQRTGICPAYWDTQTEYEIWKFLVHTRVFRDDFPKSLPLESLGEPE